jgi:hypothetical protein
MSQEIYLKSVYQVLPRLFSLFDVNPISPMLGIGDRYRWAWRGSDFANGTYQGAVHGLACLVSNDLLPKDVSPRSVMKRIDQMILAVKKITRKNGSLDEILPLESSYCVTALVAFDVLCAMRMLRHHLGSDQRKKYLELMHPLIQFVMQLRESHGIISNHLAVGAAALALWREGTSENVTKSLEITVARLLDHYSPEGWFREYNGADPGYQTLAIDYLVILDELEPSFELRPILNRACEFLCYMAHPDGSFGGGYGSRGTRFLYPAGIETLASRFPSAASLADFARSSHSKHSVVGLSSMDESNLVPMFNSFCRASVIARADLQSDPLPCQKSPFSLAFPEAGLIVTQTDTAYSIVNWKKGGAYYSSTGGSSGGTLACDARGRWYTTQALQSRSQLVTRNDVEIIIESPLLQYTPAYPTPIQTVVLRLLCLTVMRDPLINQWIKKLLVWFLVTRQQESLSACRRKITLDPFAVVDELFDNRGKLKLIADRDFSSYQMASQGYWQCGDDRE